MGVYICRLLGPGDVGYGSDIINIAVVCCINKGSSRDPALSRLLRLLGLFCAVLGISLSARHIPGATNQSADALSRGNLPLFFSQTPQASPEPTHLPTSLLELVLNQKLTVASRRWMELSLAICCTLHTFSLLIGPTMLHFILPRIWHSCLAFARRYFV